MKPKITRLGLLVVGALALGAFVGVGTLFAATATTIFSHGFGRGFSDKDTGGEVSALQRLLAKDKVIYPEGLTTGYFGFATERALQRFQKKNNIVSSGTPGTTGYGWVGKRTRAVLNSGNKTLAPIVKPTTPPATPPLTPPTVPPPTPEQNVSTVSIRRTVPIIVLKPLSGTISSSTNIYIDHVSGILEPITLQFGDLPKKANGTKLITGTKLIGKCTPPCKLAARLTAEADALSGVYPIIIHALSSSGTTTHSFNFTLLYNPKFSFHLSGPTEYKSFSATQPVAGPVDFSIPLELSLDGGSPAPTTLKLPTTLPSGVNATLSSTSCTLPCTVTLKLSLQPEVKVGTYTITINAVAQYIDNVTGKAGTMSKSYSTSMKVF